MQTPAEGLQGQSEWLRWAPPAQVRKTVVTLSRVEHWARLCAGPRSYDIALVCEELSLPGGYTRGLGEILSASAALATSGVQTEPRLLQWPMTTVAAKEMDPGRRIRVTPWMKSDRTHGYLAQGRGGRRWHCLLVGVLGAHLAGVPGKGPSSWEGWHLQGELLISLPLPGTGLVCLHLRGDLSSLPNVFTVDSNTHTHWVNVFFKVFTVKSYRKKMFKIWQRSLIEGSYDQLLPVRPGRDTLRVRMSRQTGKKKGLKSEKFLIQINFK